MSKNSSVTTGAAIADAMPAKRRNLNFAGWVQALQAYCKQNKGEPILVSKLAAQLGRKTSTVAIKLRDLHSMNTKAAERKGVKPNFPAYVDDTVEDDSRRMTQDEKDAQILGIIDIGLSD